MSVSYADAGVNISAGNEAVSRIKSKVEATHTSAVLNGLGGFAALYDLSWLTQQYTHPVMVQSIDGVGTKTIVARMAGHYQHLGHDLLAATSNDILVMGAKTLTLLDYIANDKLQPAIIEAIVSGMCEACIAHDVALVGGETAEMPNTYLPGEHDLVGVVTGVVDKHKIIDGGTIQAGDRVLGLGSSGLHTNGFSLARKLLFEMGRYKIDDYVPDLGCSLAEALLAPHLNYAKPIHAALEQGIAIKGMAHITGGGLTENIPRVLPHHCSVEIDATSWPIPPLFHLLLKLGNIPTLESYRVFNMGIGMVLICDRSQEIRLRTLLQHHPGFHLHAIGTVVPGDREVHYL